MSDLWKSHNPPSPPNVPAPVPASVPSLSTGVVTEHATIGRSVAIKGEVSGNEAAVCRWQHRRFDPVPEASGDGGPGQPSDC